jgi:hypothetical protein
MLTQCSSTGPCVIYGIDVTNDGQFKARKQGLSRIEVSKENQDKFWSKLNEKESIFLIRFANE